MASVAVEMRFGMVGARASLSLSKAPRPRAEVPFSEVFRGVARHASCKCPDGARGSPPHRGRFFSRRVPPFRPSRAYVFLHGCTPWVEDMKDTSRRNGPEEPTGEVAAEHAEPLVPRRQSSVPPFHRREAEAGAVVGAIAGAAIGAVAGPPGIFAGTAIGAAIGAAAGAALDANDAWQDRRDSELDEDIGVAGGDIGAAPPNQPPARVGHVLGRIRGRRQLARITARERHLGRRVHADPDAGHPDPAVHVELNAALERVPARRNGSRTRAARRSGVKIGMLIWPPCV